MTLKILNAEPLDYSPEAMSLLQSLGHVTEGPLTRGELKKNIGTFDILITRLGHRIDAEILQQAEKLKIIVTATTGLNHIDLVQAQIRNIKVLSLQGEREFLDTICATAEHTLALMLALLRNIPAAHNHVMDGQWNRDGYRGLELKGRNLGIIGYGRLGSKVAQYAAVFGMHVFACDILQFKDTGNVRFVSMQELLKASDIISLHVPHTPETENLIDKKAFAQMKPGAFLINTSRGEIVDEDALLTALKSGRLTGAALDVLRDENSGEKNWLKESDLRAYAENNANLIITPHIGGATYDSMARTEIFMAKKLQAALTS